MRILFVADGRSPTAINWIRYFVESGDEVHLASTFECQPELDLKGVDFIPVAFSKLKAAASTSTGRRSATRTLKLRTAIRHVLGPLTITRAAARLRELTGRIKPDLIHAMRIPFEGMLAAEAYRDIPLLVSVWGNDFTLHAPATPLMRHYTQLTMRVADALHADCQRDIRLALEWGYPVKLPFLVIPGNGGVHLEGFHPPQKPVEAPIAINPRGFRAYVRNDTFFEAIPLVLKQVPQARFLCTAMQGDRQALAWIDKLGIADSVVLLARLPHAQMAAEYRRAAVLVSPSMHDGTPNTLLEGMACGCFPVAGDIESIREWIDPGENGFLVDPTDPEALARAIVQAFARKDLRAQAAGLNQKRIQERADYSTCMAQARRFYGRIVAGGY